MKLVESREVWSALLLGIYGNFVLSIVDDFVELCVMMLLQVVFIKSTSKS